MGGKKVDNLVHITNRRIDILNGRLAAYDCEMYEVPSDPDAQYIRMMVGDLDWLMESIEPTAGRDSPVYHKYTDVRERLTQIHAHLRTEESANAAP